MNTKFGVFALLVGMSGIAYGANTPSSIEIKRKTNTAIFNLVYHGQSPATVKIHIMDEKGTVLAYRVVKNLKDFSLPVNFASQSPGKYVIKIDDVNGSQLKEVTLDENKTYSSYVTALKDNRYLVSVVNPERESVRINIFDEDRTLVLTQQVKSDVALLFNMSKIKGRPVFEIEK